MKNSNMFTNNSVFSRGIERTRSKIGRTLAFAVIMLLGMTSIALATQHGWVGNDLKEHQVWDPLSSVLDWVPGQPKGYTEGQTAAFRVKVEANEGLELKFQICLDLDDSGAFAFTDIESWDTTYMKPGHLTDPPAAVDLTGDVSGVNASNATIDTVTFLGEETGSLGTLCPINYQAWEVEFTMANDGSAPIETITAYIVYGGHVAAPGDSIASGGSVPVGQGASATSGVFQARIASQGTGDKTINFMGGDFLTQGITVQKVCLSGSESFNFTVNGDTKSINCGASMDFSLAPGTYTVLETVPAGWGLISTACSYNSTSRGTTDLPGSPSHSGIVVAMGENIVCVFTNDIITSIELASFNVQPGRGTATINWETGTEIDNAGFNLYRATSADGPWVRINSQLIPAEGGELSGTSYTYVDTPGRGTYYYLLEDIDYGGISTRHDEVLIDLGPTIRRPWYRPVLRWFGIY